MLWLFLISTSSELVIGFTKIPPGESKRTEINTNIRIAEGGTEEPFLSNYPFLFMDLSSTAAFQSLDWPRFKVTLLLDRGVTSGFRAMGEVSQASCEREGFFLPFSFPWSLQIYLMASAQIKQKMR